LYTKGQEEAPFQLLVAVILMTFVIIVGLRAIEQAEEQKCFYDTEKSMDDLRTAIERTVQNHTPSIIRFTPPGCSDEEQFFVLKTDYENLCKRTCMNASSVCVLLRYSTSETSGIQDKCINIPYDTQFRHVGDDTDSCQEIDGYKKLEMESNQGLILGSYYLVYYDNPAINYPIVCSYIKE